ncbi:hypothetical protein THAOC_07740, partial [Thalassiosira oceanica]
MPSSTINAVGRSILTHSRCTVRIGFSRRLRGEANVFGLGWQRVTLLQARSGWSAPVLGLCGELAVSTRGLEVEPRRSPHLIRSASSSCEDGTNGSATNGIEEEDTRVIIEDEEDIIVIGDPAWKEILDSLAPEYDEWVGVHTDEGKQARAKIYD